MRGIHRRRVSIVEGRLLFFLLKFFSVFLVAIVTESRDASNLLSELGNLSGDSLPKLLYRLQRLNLFPLLEDFGTSGLV